MGRVLSPLNLSSSGCTASLVKQDHITPTLLSVSHTHTHTQRGLGGHGVFNGYHLYRLFKAGDWMEPGETLACT